MVFITTNHDLQQNISRIGGAISHATSIQVLLVQFLHLGTMPWVGVMINDEEFVNRTQYTQPTTRLYGVTSHRHFFHYLRMTNLIIGHRF